MLWCRVWPCSFFLRLVLLSAKSPNFLHASEGLYSHLLLTSQTPSPSLSLMWAYLYLLGDRRERSSSRASLRSLFAIAFSIWPIIVVIALLLSVSTRTATP